MTSLQRPTEFQSKADDDCTGLVCAGRVCDCHRLGDHQCGGRYGRRAARRHCDGLVRGNHRSRRVPAGRLERDGDPGEHLGHRRVLREERACRAGSRCRRCACPAVDPAAGDDPLGALGRDLDVRRQRRRHPDDGSGGAAAGPRAETAGDAGRADDRLQCQFHGHRAAAGRSAAADDAQRLGCRVHGLHLATGASVVVPDTDGDLRDHAGGDVCLRLSRARPAGGGCVESWYRDAHPEQAVRRRRGRMVPADRASAWHSARCSA